MYRIVFIMSLVVFMAIPVSAQMNAGTSLSSDISITTTPSNPRPSEPIVLEVKSYSIDIYQANISWRYNGTVVASGIGKTKIQSVAPQANTTAIISVTLSGTGFETTTSAITLRTASVDLLWEASDGYTHPFYKGKSLFTPSSTLRITAIPTYSAPKNLVFNWSRNDSAYQDGSGYNKNSIVFKNEILQQQEKVSVTAQSGFFGGTNSLTITPQKPDLVLYENKDGFIDYNNGSISSYTTTNPGASLRFEPYFFSVRKSLVDDLDFDIKDGDNSLYGDKYVNELSISKPDSGDRGVLSVNINTKSYSLQNILRNFTILFK